MKYQMQIEGMHCMHCADKVEKTLKDLGMDAKVDLNAKACVAEGAADEKAIRDAIAAKGFEVTQITAL